MTLFSEMLLETVLFYGFLPFFLVFIFIYVYFQYSYTYWRRKAVPYIKPKFPLGNNDCIAPQATSYGLETVAWYKDFKSRGLKYGGAWSWAKPVLLLTDPDYIRDVLLKDFQYFVDRDMYSNPVHDPKNESLFVVKKDEWKNMRTKLSPVFTSAKMKMMFDMVVECSKPMIECIEAASGTKDDIDIKDLLASFTIDVIGCVAFGLEFDCFKDKDSQFRQMGREFVNVDIFRATGLLTTRICEKLAVHLGFNNIPKVMTKFFVDVVKNNIEFRKKNNIYRPDFTQLMMEVFESTKNDEHPFTKDNLIANTTLFFIAGFDTSSTTMQFVLYELARNPELQEKTRAEINKVLEKHDGKFTYEAFKDMTYLRQVLDETLRMYPPVQNLARISVKPYTFKDTNFTLEKGITVLVSTSAMGRDPDYFPDPDKFDPERFNTENKAVRNPYVYLPFGEGPRNCIGMRFGIMQSSIGIVRILRKFRISISPSTQLPLTLMRGVFLLQTNETLYLKAEKL